MVTYNRLWQTMREKGISQYKLIHHYGVSSSQISRLKKNTSVTTHTIDVLCTILDCRVEDVMEFHMDKVFNPNLGVIPNHTYLTATPDSLPEGTASSAPADLESILPKTKRPSQNTTKNRNIQK